MGGEGSEVVEYSSSGEEDGDEEWRAAINSVAGGGGGGGSSNGRSSGPFVSFGENGHERAKPQPLKHYQIEGQKKLFALLEKSLIFVSEDNPKQIIEEEEDAVAVTGNEGGFRLFKQAPCGMVVDHRDELEGPKKKPRILPGDEVEEKSKKFRKRLQSVAVEGTHVLAAAEEAQRKSRARLQARETAAKEAAKREEERVAELKRMRGERWLPCIAREMQTKMNKNIGELRLLGIGRI